LLDAVHVLSVRVSSLKTRLRPVTPDGMRRDLRRVSGNLFMEVDIEGGEFTGIKHNGL